MTEDPELEKLREMARLCRYEPDTAMVERVRARVSERIAQPSGIWELLVVWLRPVAATLVILIGLLALVLSRETASSDLLASMGPLPAAEELYGDVE